MARRITGTHHPASIIRPLPMARATFRKNETPPPRCHQRTAEERTQHDRSSFPLVGRITPLDTTAPAQVAFAIPKRYVHDAVDRNRIRRRMREAYRLDKEKWYAPLRVAGQHALGSSSTSLHKR